MRCAGLALATVLAWSLGRVGGSSEPGRVSLGESFVLRIGQSARIETEALHIGFEDVPADSRCPKGEQCVREGDATVRVWLRTSSEAKETLELRTSSQADRAVSALGYEVRLVRVDPYPVSGRTIARGDYAATLELTRGSSAAPDR